MTTPWPDIDTWRQRGTVRTVLGRSIFVVDAGPRDAPALVILHGYPTSSHDYAKVLPALTQHHRVIVHDHVGFGLSERPADYSYSLVDQAEVALCMWRDLGVDRATLFAHDYGTSVATEILARREGAGVPIHLNAVTLCNGSMHIELAQLRPIQRLLAADATGDVVARLATFSTFRRNLRRIVAQPDELEDEHLRTMWEMLTRDGGRAALPQITRYLHERRRLWHRWIGALTRLDLPCQVLWGDLDPVATAAIAHQLAAEIPHVTLAWLKGVGHYPMVEAPTRWSDALLAFTVGSAALEPQ